MEDERITILMKYVRGEISFEQWIERGGGSGDAEIEDSGVQDVDGEGNGESQTQMAESEDNSETPGKRF